MPDQNDADIRRRVHSEVDSLSAAQLQTFRLRRAGARSWIYRMAYRVGRTLGRILVVIRKSDSE